MSIVTTRRAKCDTPDCGAESPAFGTWSALLAYVTKDLGDGRWYVADGTQRTICRGCIIDRACRIFGHVLIEMPISAAHPYRRETWCNRCQNPIAVAS